MRRLQHLIFCLHLLDLACNQRLTSGEPAWDSDPDGASGSEQDLGAAGGSASDLGPLPDGGVIVVMPDGGIRVCVVTACDRHVYQCGDCKDNDGDGRIDSDDPECLGPCDHSEQGLHPAIPGGNNAPCKQDCFFDQDTGSGNDDCYWDHRCDQNEVPPDYHPEGPQCRYDATTRVGDRLSCAQASNRQSETCGKICGPLTPNGCDCFGCCDIGPQAIPGIRGVWLGSRNDAGQPSCTLDKLGDPRACRPCQIVSACHNTCKRCEVCLGKPTVPADCFASGGDGGSGGGNNPEQCEPGVQPCGQPGQASCPPQWYCVTGCCRPPLG